MTEQQLHDVAIGRGYHFDNLKNIYDSQPPENQNESTIVELYEFSLNETLEELQTLIAECDKLQSDYNKFMETE